MAATSPARMKSRAISCRWTKKIWFKLLWSKKRKRVRDRTGWKQFLANKQGALVMETCAIWAEDRALTLLDQ